MNMAMPARQRGLSLSGLMVGSVVLILVSVTGLKLIPAYMENATITNLFTVIATDTELQNASPRDIRMAFIKRASVENVTAIKSDDIEITRDGGTLVLSASYSVKVPLVANISLFLDFNPSSAK